MTYQAAGRWLALSATLLFANFAAAQLEIPSRGCPVKIVNPGSTATSYNDWSFHTYSAPFAGVGGYADCPITREFHKPIKSIQVFVEGGQADDIGWVGSQIVTSTPARCAGVGAVMAPVDVTSQVLVDGNRAILTLRAQENCCCTTGWGSMTQLDRKNAKLHWIVELESDALVKIETPGSDPVVAEGGGQLRFPLGYWFSLQYYKVGANNEDVPIPATYEIESMAVSPATEQRTLFPGKTIIPVDAAGPSTKKRFQTVHLGTALVKVTPVDDKLPVVRYTISVDRPARLGSGFNEFDAFLIDLAHARGIPPQFLKGQVQKESDFRGTAYRYEPLSTEFLSIGPRGDNLRIQTPYSDYRLATADGLTQGQYLTEQDVSPRSRYSIVRNGQRRPIANTDRYVSALEIYRENEASSSWNRFAPDSRIARIRRDPSLIDYTAQTPLAASYGWFQVLYTTAHYTRWRGVAGRYNPAYLFDNTANHRAGGGSIRIAMVLLHDNFVSANGGTGADRYASVDAFVRPYQRMFVRYNGGEAYGRSVTDVFAPRWAPVRARPIVQP